MIRSVIMIRLGGVSPSPFSSLPVLIHCIIMVSDFSFVFEIVFIFPLLFPPAQFINARSFDTSYSSQTDFKLSRAYSDDVFNLASYGSDALW